jgi:hypothetical protein
MGPNPRSDFGRRFRVVVSLVARKAQPHLDHRSVHVGRFVASLDQPSDGGSPSGGELSVHILVHNTPRWRSPSRKQGYAPTLPSTLARWG